LEKLLISACLLGERVRHHGGDSRLDHPTLRRWAAEGRIVALCPEVSGGLSTPRPAAEIVTTLTGRRVLTAAGADVTAAFKAGADLAVRLCREHGIRVAVLKERSPSCGSQAIFDGTFQGRTTAGRGITAERLIAEGVSVFNEAQIDEAEGKLRAIETG
jgi:uncharacterized protein YbbK (DUF523 family)